MKKPSKNSIKGMKISFLFILLSTFSLGGCALEWNLVRDSSSKRTSSSNGDSISSLDSANSSSSETIGEGDYSPISFHFLTLGNNFNGDSIYIKAGDNDILIDAGSRINSAPTIESYIDQYCNDKKLEYVIATHAHQDHIAAFSGDEGIFAKYEVGTIIDFGETKAVASSIYSKYCEGRDESVKNGAKYYSSKQCFYETDGAQKVYSLGEGLSMRILYQEAYDIPPSSNENNNSVCLLFEQGEKKMLFTGDLEEKGCKSLLDGNEIGEVDLYKGGHHGSINANPDFFLDEIKPKTICTCCVAGSEEYTEVKENTMPYQRTIDNWAKYTDDVYLTSYMKYDADPTIKGTCMDLNGNITVNYNKTGQKSVKGSASSAKLKDSEWMKNNRTMPKNWLS